MMKVGIFHVGTQHSWQTAQAFQDAGELAWYATSVFYKPKTWPYRVENLVPGRFGESVRRDFRRRYTPLLQQEKIHLVGTYEWGRTVARRLHLAWADHHLNLLNIRKSSERVIKLMQREPVDVLWGFNTMALQVFKAAKKRGVRCVLDQTIGHPASMNALFEREHRHSGNYFRTPYIPFSAEWIAHQNAELELADEVVVGSEFCADTLIENGCDAAKIKLLPYGFDETRFNQAGPRVAPENGQPLKFLFVGALEPRKGAHYLIEAFKKIPASLATLTIVGRQSIPPARIAEAPAHVKFVPQVPRSEIPDYFKSADCFIFPSLFEGSALVLYEALGAGLGIIQTKSAGFGVKDGVNGVLLKQPSVESIIDAITMLSENRHLVSRWSLESLEIGAAHRWTDYRRHCRELIYGTYLAQ